MFNLFELLEYANLAPSYYNTQPWKLAFHDNTILISADTKLDLNDLDPSNSFQLISIGCFIQNVILLLTSCKRFITIEYQNQYPNIAKITVNLDSQHVTNEHSYNKLIQLMKKRQNYRNKYLPQVIEKPILSTEKIIFGRKIDSEIKILKEKSSFKLIEKHAKKGMNTSSNEKLFKKTLNKMFPSILSSAKKGVPISALNIPVFTSNLIPILSSNQSIGKLIAKTKYPDILTADGIIILSSKSDIKSLVQTGQDLQSILLHLSDQNIATCLYGAPLLNKDSSTDIQTKFSLTNKPQILFTYGIRKKSMIIEKIERESIQSKIIPYLSLEKVQTSHPIKDEILV